MDIVLRVILVVAALGICFYAGRGVSQRYVRRELYFSELLQLCSCLEGEIRFMQLPLPLIADKYKDTFRSGLAAQLQAFSALLSSSNSTGSDELRRVIARECLNSDEYDTVIKLLSGLGKSDTDSQIAALKGFEERFRHYHAIAAEQKKKYGALYWKLGLLAGAALSIFII